MKKLSPFLKPYRKECVLAPLFKCLEACVDLFVPLCMADLVDKGIAPKDNAFLWHTALLLFALALIGLGFSVVAQWFSAKAATGFSAGVRSAAFRHIEALSFSTGDRQGSDTLITRLTSDVNQMQTGVNMVLRLALRSPFIVFGALVMALTVDASTAWIFALTILILGIIVGGIMALTLPRYREVQQKLDRVVLHTRENLTGVRVLRAFRLEESEKKEFHGANALYTHTSLAVGRLSALTNPLTLVVVNLATAGLLYAGALRVDGGALTQGQVIALVNYMAQILVELVKLANLILTVTKALASAGRVEQLLELPAEELQEGEELSVLTYDLVFDNVSFTYDGAGAEALSGISFTIRQGETVGVIGGTGSGKSTLVQLIPRYYNASSGSVRLGGRDLRGLSLASLRGAVGMVLQKALLFRGTIRDNICFGAPDATDEEIWEALKAAQAEDFVRALPDGLDALVEQGGRNLSGGQRQRLGIARALVRRPRILILDDSASALDFATDAALRRALRALPFAHTTFLVSQRASSLMHADRILVLADGKLVGNGTHAELIAGCPVYREIVASQMPKEVAHVG